MTSNNRPQRVTGEGVSEHVARNVQAIGELHLQAESMLSAHQRAVESGTALLGRPASLYIILAGVLLWTAGNTLCARLGGGALDAPPFSWLQGMVGLMGLLTTTMVLITQGRQARLSEQRMHLDLQINLLTEQKTAKLIELIEELRRDLPNVRDRRDAEAEVMQRSAQPLEVIAALEEHTIEAVREALTEDRAVASGEGETS